MNWKLLVSFTLLILFFVPESKAWSGHVESYTYSDVVLGATSIYCSSCVLWWCTQKWRMSGWVIETGYRCSSGWTDTNGDRNCVIPICNPSCMNGGTCVAPNKCACPAGFDGPDTSCTKLNCSHLLPCYPGTCISPNGCRCDYGFSGSDGNACLTMSMNYQLRLIGVSMVTLAHLRRMDNTTKFSYSMDTVNYDTFWSNQMDFNFLGFKFLLGYTPPQLPYRPIYINEAQLGIVDAQITANISKNPRSGTMRDTSFYRQYKCSNVTIATPVVCIINDNQFSPNIEHGDRLKVVFVAKSGGFRKLVNLDNPNSIWKTQFYQGLIDQREVELTFDLYAPMHCSESNSTVKCGLNDVPLKIENEFTKLPINISWAGWYDDLSNMDRYHIEVFKLSPDPFGDLQEMTPLNPDYYKDFEHGHDGIYQCSYTPSEDGMYSVLLQAFDKANNSKIARRLVLYARNSFISRNQNEDGRLYVSSAESETGYMWQRTNVGQTTTITVEWKNHFINTFVSEEKLLNKVKAYPIQFQDTQSEGILQILKFVSPGLDDKEGQRTIDETPMKHVFVRFETGISFSVGNIEPPIRLLDINGLAENYTFNLTLRDKRTAYIWVKAHDGGGNIITDKTEVHFDFSPPTFKNDSIVFTRNHQGGSYAYTSRIEFDAADLESGVHKIGYLLTRDNSRNILHNGSSVASYKDISCNGDIDCKCVLGKCFIQHQALDLDNCWFMVSKEELDHVNITVEVTVFNQAMLKNSFYVTVNKLNELRGLEQYSGPTNIRVTKSNSNGVRLEWDLLKTKSCYERTNIVIILYLSDGSTKVYTVSRNTKFVDITGLDPGKGYTAAFSLGYEEQRMGNMQFYFQTAAKEDSIPTAVKIGVIAVFSIIGLIIAIFIVLQRRGILGTIRRRLSRFTVRYRNRGNVSYT